MKLDIPSRIIKHREELVLRISDMRAHIAAAEHQLAGIDLCISAIEDAAKAPNAEAVEGGMGAAARVIAAEAENAPAGGIGATMAFCPIHDTYDFCPHLQSVLPAVSFKKPRAPKRDIRGMVLDYVEHYSGGNLDQDQIWRLLGVPPRAVAMAIVYWQAKGRLTLADGVVRLADAPADESAQGDAEVTRFGGDGWRDSAKLEHTEAAE